MSAYVDFAISYKNTLNMIYEIDSNKLSDRKRYGNAIANTYSKGVEFIGKTFVTCITMNFIINNQDFDYTKVYNLKLYDKSQLLNKISNDKTKVLLKFINRNLRNSEAHLSLTFNPINNIYTYKKSSKNKTKLIHIPGEQIGCNIESWTYSR